MKQYLYGGKIYTKHGLSRRKEYAVWKAMRQRCENPRDKNYANYGGRGIAVCDKWAHFENFYEDMGACPAGQSLERKDNEKGYSPDNCVWADRTAQNRNRRNAIVVIYKGKERLLVDVIREEGVDRRAVYQRFVSQGWTLERAIEVTKMRQAGLFNGLTLKRGPNEKPVWTERRFDSRRVRNSGIQKQKPGHC